MDITITQWIIAIIACLLVGFSKTGLPSLGIFAVALFASIFPAKESVGILLTILITADIIAVSYYRRTVIWKHLITLIPWVLIGIVGGYFVLDAINNEALSKLIGALVLILILLHVVKDKWEDKLKVNIEQSRIFPIILGILAGFATMIGNAAGAIMAVYLLSRGLQKKEFVGTGAVFFLSVNLIKVPFNVQLGLINTDTLLFNAWMIPVIVLGTIVGIKILPKISQKYFQILILTLAALGAINLLL